jgi:peroxin-19
MVTNKEESRQQRKKREDLYFILDAALDDLEDDDYYDPGNGNGDGDSDGDSSDDRHNDDNDDGSSGDESVVKDGHVPVVHSRFDSHIVDGTRQLEKDTATSSYETRKGCEHNEQISESEVSGVPYSLEYLVEMRRREEEKNVSNRRRECVADNCTSSRPVFGPEPPPTLLFDINPTGDENSDFADSLEGLMKQFTEGLKSNGDFDLEDDVKLDEMLKTMMMGMNEIENINTFPWTTQGGVTSDIHGNCNGDGSALPPSSATASTYDKSKKAVPRKVKGSSGTTKKATRMKEPNVDESINRLLDGINQASSSAPNNIHPPPPHRMEGINPSQLEKFSEEMMSSIMCDFEKMGDKNHPNNLMDNVMKQLLDKDLMYEPMREVCNRFPKYMAKNKEKISKDEYTRYAKQYQYFQKIVHLYETEPGNFGKLMGLMQDIQEYGQPPLEIIKELAPDLEFDKGGMPIMDPMGGGGGMMMPGMFPGMIPGGVPFPGSGMGNEQCCMS